MQETNRLTHMPFLLYDLRKRRTLFFTVSDESEPHRWKLYYTINDNAPQRLETGLPHDWVECSPTAWEDESGWHVSLIATDKSGIARLYRMDGTALETMSQPISLRIARTGFVYQDRLAVGEIQDVVHVHDTSGDHKIEIPGAFIYRVSYRADSPDKILISGDWIGETMEPFTLEYDLTNDSQRYIECDGQGAYKCTIYGDEILYAERVGAHFENRRLRQATNIHGVSCKMAHRHKNDNSAALLTRTKQCGCRRNAQENNIDENVSRPSCLECVEKHLGAAFVIASEIRDGYAYRLRLIGHLHEAEDESQEWETLHLTIRQARKAYQMNNEIPDWEQFAEAIAEVRHAR
ncbi:MAG: hypothetical protein LBT05_14925 [Planctomycetaceae bacterium]|jgi:hypothetical protein|nr:hypothetical protein [Planctomycetaceae bacterium]